MKKLLFILFLFPALLIAQKKHSIEKADAAFDNAKYTDAIDLYKDAYTHIVSKQNNKQSNAKDIKAEKAKILFQIAECYRMTNDCKQEVQWYQKAIKARYPDSAARQYLSAAQQCLDRYDSINKANYSPVMKPGPVMTYNTRLSDHDTSAPPVRHSGVYIVPHDTADTVRSFRIGKLNATIAGKREGTISKDALLSAGEIRITGRKDVSISGFTMHIKYTTMLDSTKHDQRGPKTPAELTATNARFTPDMIKAIKNCKPGRSRDVIITFDNIKYINGGTEGSLNDIVLVLGYKKEGE